MSFVIPIFASLFSLALVRTILFWVSYVQRKQYRLDRLWHAINDVGFWGIFWSKTRLAALALFITWQVTVRVWQSATAFDWLFYIASALFAFEAGMGLWHLAKGRLEQPVWTYKSGALAVMILVVTMLLLRLPWVGTTAVWRIDIILPELALLVAVIEPFIVFTIFSVLFLPNWLWQKRTISLATAKRGQLHHVQAIGITGSVGKTSMKEYIAHFLATEFRVLKTSHHINVDTGIAQQVLTDLNDQYDFYVVEMGAYRAGEIASICRIVAPTFGVLTALGNQHLELFGSPQRLRDAKFELAKAVASKNNLFANHDSARLQQACVDKGLEPVWFGINEDATNHPTGIEMDETGTRFIFDGQPYRIPGFGTARLTNVIGALTVAKQLGVPAQKLAKAAARLPEVSHTMQLRAGKKGSLVIDSTYNASLDSVLQAVNDLSFINRKQRIIVFKDILELGGESAIAHKRCAEAMAKTNARLLLLPSLWCDVIREEWNRLSAPSSSIVDESNLDATLESINKDTVVLCLGRDTQPLMNRFLAL